MFSVLCALLSGCRVHEYCEYKSISKDMLGGQLFVGVWSRQANYKDGRKKKAKHGFPYDLWIEFHVDSYDKYSKRKLSLSTVKIIGVETGEILSFEDGEDSFTEVKNPNKKEGEKSGCSSFQFIITKDMGLTYEPFDIEAEIKIIHADGTEKSEYIKVRLEKDYKKKRQSDIWDNMMGV